MAKVRFNATLEYASNTLELTQLDDAGAPENFESPVTFNIERIDDPSAKYYVTCTVVDNTLSVIINPPKGDGTGTGINNLYKIGDSLYDYDHPSYNHIYSIKSGNTVYISGKLNLVEVAG